MVVGSFAWLFLVSGKDLRLVVLCLTIFYSMAPIPFPDLYGSAYIQDSFANGQFLFPQTFETISEIAKISLTDILTAISGSVEMGLICLIGLTLWTIRHPVTALAYVPLATFFLLNFVIGNRAVFYSAPIMWFGFGFLITSTARFVIHATLSQSSEKSGQLNKNTFTFINARTYILGSTLAAAIAWVNAPTDYIPRPSFPKPVLQGLSKIKQIATSERAVVASWWDYGYASLFLNNLPTLHDGGSQTQPTTHFFAYAMLRPSQNETIRILQLLASKGTICFSIARLKTIC